MVGWGDRLRKNISEGEWIRSTCYGNNIVGTNVFIAEPVCRCDGHILSILWDVSGTVDNKSGSALVHTWFTKRDERMREEKLPWQSH